MKTQENTINGKRSSMKKILWCSFYVFLFALLLQNSFSYLDPDFGWHLRFGEIIMRSGAIPHDQIFMWTLAGKNWVDHEWIGNLGLYVIFSKVGYITLSLVFACIPLLAIALINRQLLRYYIKKSETIFLLAVLEIGALFFSLNHFGIRLQELTFLFLACLLLIIDRCNRERRILNSVWLLIPLFYLWACAHAGFLIGLAVFGAWVGLEILFFYIPRLAKLFSRQPLSAGDVLKISIAFVLSAVATLVTPYGTELYSFLGDYRNTYYMDHIQEWRPPYAFPIHYGQILFTALAAVTSIGTFLLLRKRELLYNAGIVLFFCILSLRSVRHFPLLVVCWFILIIPHCLPELTATWKAPTKRFIAFVSIASLLALSIGLFASTRYTNDPFNAYCRSYPCAAINYLRAHPEHQDRIFNHYNFGGFVIGVWPEARLFIDGRLSQYPFAGKTMLEEYDSFNAPDAAEKKLTEYTIKTVFYTQPSGKAQPDWFEHYVLGYTPEYFSTDPAPLIVYLQESSAWKKVYEDAVSVIYVRK